MIDPDIVIAILASLTVIIPALLAYRQHIWSIHKELMIQQLENQNKQNETEYNIIENLLNLEVLSQVKNTAEDIFRNTKADRFLVLTSFNGTRDLTHVAVIFQCFNTIYSVNAIANYRKIKVDIPYKDMLKSAERYGSVYLEVERMESCMLKSIYVSEKVKFSDIYHLFRHNIVDGSDLLCYVSIATHKDTMFTKEERHLFKMRLDSIVRPAIEKLISGLQPNYQSIEI